MAPVEKSEDLLGRAWDRCVANALIKTGAGVVVGGLFSLMFFKRKAWPVTLGGGLGFGLAIGNCNQYYRFGLKRPPWESPRRHKHSEDRELMKSIRRELWKEYERGEWTPEERRKIKREILEDALKKLREHKSKTASEKETLTEESVEAPVVNVAVPEETGSAAEGSGSETK